MPKPDETAFVVVDQAQQEGGDALAEQLELHTGLRARSFTGVRDPSTGAVRRYIAIDAPLADVQRIAGRAGRVYVDSLGAGCTYRSISTIKADIAGRIYNTSGKGIVWALFDSGVDASHPHFKLHDNLTLRAPLRHIDLIARDGAEAPLVDEYGHGTTMAGIIAGANRNVSVAERVVSDKAPENGRFVVSEVPFISGMAPNCKILSVKVLGIDGAGQASTVIEGLSRIQQMNDGGRQLLVHGINLGLGFDYDVSRFACGRTPLCMEVDRMVRSGVVVVTPAGNRGFEAGGGMHGIEVSIQDPGNAELAITVGSTHRELPHMYGVSYFSSKGPTLDGRIKPDVVAPGERIMSCATGSSLKALAADGKQGIQYYETTGTSLATAHVSGACAALLSARNELRGQPELLKSLLMETAVDLGRSRFFQGRGLIDVLQAVQANVPFNVGRATDEHFEAPRPRIVPAPPPASAPRYGAKAETHLQTPLRVMYSYAHEDEQYKGELHIYLGGMRNQGLIDVWQDRLILPGSEFDKDIARALEESDIIVLLVTAPFLDSKYCWGIEMTRAVQRHDEGTAKVVPIILKPTPSWRETPFGKLIALPKDGKPVTTWENRDLAWTEVAEELRRLVVSMQSGNRSGRTQ